MTLSKQDKEIDLSRYCKDDGRTLEGMALVPVVKKRGRPSLSINKSINKKSNKSNNKSNKKSSMIQVRHVYVKEKRKRSASKEEEEDVEERDKHEKSPEPKKNKMEKEKEEEKDEILVGKDDVNKNRENRNEELSEKEKRNGTNEKKKKRINRGKTNKNGDNGENSRKNWIEEAREAKSYLLNKMRAKGNEMHELVMCFDCEAFEKGDYRPTREKLQQYMQSWSEEDRLLKVQKAIGYITEISDGSENNSVDYVDYARLRLSCDCKHEERLLCVYKLYKQKNAQKI